MAIDFILNRTNVKAINVIDKNGIATGLRKVVDQYGNILWQGMIETNFSDVYLYISNGSVVPNNIRVGGTYTTHYNLLNSETGEELYYYDVVTENRYVKATQSGSKIYINSDTSIPESYEGYYYGVELIFSGYDDGTNLYDSCYYDFMFETPIKAASLDYGSGWIVYTSSDDRFTAKSTEVSSDYSGYITSWSWTWKLYSSPFDGRSDGYTIQTKPTSTQLYSYLTKADIITELKNLKTIPDTISGVYPNGPYYIYATFEAKTNLINPDYDPDSADEDDDGYISLYQLNEYNGTITIPYAWSVVEMLLNQISGNPFRNLAIFRARSKSKTVMKNAILSGRFSLYADGVIVKYDIPFSAPYKDSDDVTDISAGSGWYDEYDNYAYISTGVEPDFGRTYKGTITIPEAAGWEAYSNTFEKLLKPYEYEWGASSNDGTEPELCLGSQVNYWPTTTPQYSNHVYVAVYDYPNGSASTDMSFSGKLQIYKNNSYSTTVTFSASKPNKAGNLILDTGLTYDPNVDYKVILTIDPGYKTGFKPLVAYEVTKGNADMRGVSVDVSAISGATVTYIPDYGTSSTYGARIFFNASATYTVKVTIGRRLIGDSNIDVWRVYSMFVNDGNKAWSDKATMLISVSSESSKAWYYKNGTQYGVEFGLESGYEYYLTAVVVDLLTYYSDLLLSAPQNKQYNYSPSGISDSNPFYSSDWTTTNSSGTSNPTIPGSYAYTLTKKDSMKIWSDDYTRLKASKTRYVIISKQILYSEDYEFTGSYTFTAGQTYQISQNSDGYATYSGTTKASNAGTYTYYVTPNSYSQWANGSTSAMAFTWTIAKRAVTPPTANGTHTYDGYSKSALSSYDSTYISITGTLNATFVGSFTCYADLKYPNDTYWSSGSSSGTRTYNWSIAKKRVSLPVAKSNLVYNGSSQVGVSNPDSKYITISGNTATNAGDYTATASLSDPDNTEWNATPSYGNAYISWYIDKYTISSSDLTVTLGKSGGYVRAKVTSGKSFLNGLSYTGRFRKNTTSNYGNDKSGTIGNWVTSSWKINGSDKYGFVVESVSGDGVNINSWSGSKGAGSWYTG